MEKLKWILKSNVFIYKIYSFIVSNIFKFLSLFIKVEDNVILINSFGGKKYDDSTKVIYEYMISSKKYDKYKIYWAFEKPELYEINYAEKVNVNSFKYFLIALKAKYWITNSGIERGLKFKNKKTIYINTWHGSTIKKMGADVSDKSFKFLTSEYNVMFAQSQYDIDIFSRCFKIPREKFALVGLPRNDELKNVSNDEILNIKINLGIPLDKKIILYAPTFREYQRDNDGCVIAPPVDLEKWKGKLGAEYVVLFRAHYEVNKILNIQNNGFVYDVSKYDTLNDLLKISDILISDYSSIMFDYSILERPIYSYAYDYDEYVEKRGIYIDLNEELPNGYQEKEDDILDLICNCDFEIQRQKTINFKQKYVQACGEARKYIDKIILRKED